MRLPAFLRVPLSALTSTLALTTASAQPLIPASDLIRYRDYVFPPGGPSAPAAPQALIAVPAVPAAPDGATVTYTSFHNLQQYSLIRFNGRHTALLLQRRDLDRMGLARIRKLIDEQDILYEAMAEVMGREPPGADLVTVAVVDTTCLPAGCALLDAKGVEILPEVLHSPEVMAYITHEMLHNFDRISFFVFNGMDILHAWNAFWDAFLPIYLQKGRNSLDARDDLALQVEERLSAFRNSIEPGYESCVLFAACDPPGPVTPLVTALFSQGGPMLRIAQLHGHAAIRNWLPTLESLIVARGLDPVNRTLFERRDLLIETLGLAVRADVSCYFDSLNWEVVPAVRAALSVFGPNPRCQDADGDGRTAFTQDCREGDATVFPGAVETVDGVDDDCNGAVDDVLLAESGDFPDDAATALAVPLASRLAGSAGPGGDADFFRIVLAAPAWVRFTIRSTDFSGTFTLSGPAAPRITQVDTLAIEVAKYSLAAGTWTFGLQSAQAGRYEVVAQADYAFPMAEDFWPLTFTPEPAARISADLYRFPVPATPASLAGVPGLTAHFWSSKAGPLGSLAVPAATFDWTAPAGTNPEQLAYRVFYRSGGVPVHAHSQHRSLLGPTPWSSQDIGAVGVAGSSANFGEEDFGMRGSGGDISGAADAFRFTYTSMAGDGDIRARVLAVENTDPLAKAGVMIRESLAPGARNVLAARFPVDGFTFQRRLAAGGITQGTIVAVPTPVPQWVRITRAGNLFRAFRSADGAAWSEMGSVTLDLPATVQAGLAVTSHVNTLTAGASFDHAAVMDAGVPPGLPPPWATQDVGAVGLAGSATHAAGTFTLLGGGADIWGTADAFRFAYQVFSGDVDLRARVTGLQNTDPWAKAGVMIRESLSANSQHALMLVSAGSGLGFQRRPVAGGNSEHTGAGGGVPKWLRLTRVGSTFTGYWSDNGTAWTQVGSANITMGATVRLGLAVTAHNNGARSQGVFTDVSVASFVPPNPWTRSDVGAVGIAGSGQVSGTNANLNGSGADIWNNADAFAFHHRAIQGDGSITARVTGVQNTDPWAKAGVMIRASLAPGSTHAMMVATPANGLAFQRRTAFGGPSAHTGAGGSAPRFVRVTRTGNLFRGFVSQNGTAWTQVGAVTINMGANAVMGLVVTSHNNGLVCGANFDNIEAVE